MRSERGEVVRHSDPRLVYGAHTTAGDVWRAATMLLLNVHLMAGVWKTETKTLDRLPTGQNIILRVFDGRPQDNAGNLSRRRAWINMNSSALSPALVWPCSERRGLVVGFLRVLIEGQTWLLDNADQGLIMVDQLGRLAENEPG